MTEILFYHLQRQAIERVLPALLEKSIERSWRVVVQAGSEERIEALDAQLWTYREGSFLPHGTWREPEAAQQPILLTINVLPLALYLLTFILVFSTLATRLRSAAVVTA